MIFSSFYFHDFSLRLFEVIMINLKKEITKTPLFPYQKRVMNVESQNPTAIRVSFTKKSQINHFIKLQIWNFFLQVNDKEQLRCDQQSSSQNIFFPRIKSSRASSDYLNQRHKRLVFQQSKCFQFTGSKIPPDPFLHLPKIKLGPLEDFCLTKDNFEADYKKAVERGEFLKYQPPETLSYCRLNK